MISKKIVLGEVIEKYPEVAPIFAGAGLHCIGCHVSAYESLEDGCLSHGFSPNDIDDLVKKANEKIALYDKLDKISFTTSAVKEFGKRILKEKSKFIKIEPLFGGEFDFVPVNKKEDDDVEIIFGEEKSKVTILIAPRIERMLRGVIIDFDLKKKDFVASRRKDSASEKKKSAKK